MAHDYLERARRIGMGLCPRCGRGKARGDKYCPKCGILHKRAEERDAKIKDAVFMHYGGWVCACCGETMKEALQVDHTNNDGAEHRRATGCGTGIRFYKWLQASGYPPGFKIYCATCNTAKQINGGVCPHEIERQKQHVATNGAAR